MLGKLLSIISSLLNVENIFFFGLVEQQCVQTPKNEPKATFGEQLRSLFLLFSYRNM